MNELLMEQTDSLHVDTDSHKLIKIDQNLLGGQRSKMDFASLVAEL